MKIIRYLRLSNQKFDLVHVHLTPCQVFTPIARFFLSYRPVLITTEHSTYNRRRDFTWGKTFDRLLFSPFDSIACISQGTRTSLLSTLPHLDNKTIVINNGIDLEKFHAKKQYKNNNSVITIVSAGRLTYYKNILTALEAVNKIRTLPFVYNIIGAGEDKSKISRTIQQLNLGEKVKLLDYRDDLSALLYKADIFLIPSLWEGFGLAAVEAMASGLPLVASDVAGLRDVVGLDGQCGFLINPKSSDDISKKLKNLILNPQLRKKMGEAAVLRAKDFSLDKMILKYLELYKRLLYK